MGRFRCGVLGEVGNKGEGTNSVEWFTLARKIDFDTPLRAIADVVDYHFRQMIDRERNMRKTLCNQLRDENIENSFSLAYFNEWFWDSLRMGK